jgi:hypothetical protein
MDRYCVVKPATPISSQFKTLFNAVIDSTAADGKLLLQITRLLFAERQNQLSYDGYFNMRANLYSKIGGHYLMVATIDTLMAKTSFSPAKDVLRSGNEIITDFIVKNLKVKPYGPILIYYDILNIANIEKKQLPLYNSTEYTDGLYLNYKSFRNQMPDRQIIVDSANLNSGDIKTIEGGGVTLKVKARDVYAIVYKGHPYVVSEGNYYPLKKVNSDFFFVGKARESIIPGDELVSDIAGGNAGVFILGGARTATFEMKIDYKNGVFLRLKLIPEAKNKK